MAGVEAENKVRTETLIPTPIKGGPILRVKQASVVEVAGRALEVLIERTETKPIK